MGYVAIEDFRGGLDRRRARVAGQPGSLWDLKNAHITRGGEIERSKRFVPTYDLAGLNTFSLAGLRDLLYTFGSVAPPAMPSGVLYQQLQHPDGVTQMIAILDWQAFDGKLYVIAKFADNSVFHYYDGQIVTDWIAGIVRADMLNLAGLANQLSALIDASAFYSATAIGSTITITGEDNIPFDLDGSIENGGAVADETMVITQTQQAVAEVNEVRAVCSFRVLGGVQNPGVNFITTVKVNGVTINSGPIDFGASVAITAADIAADINTTATSPDYTAIASGDTVVITAAAGTGANVNGFSLQVIVAGTVRISLCGFRIVGGSSSPGVNRITNVKINTVEILNVAVDWVTDNTATATAVAAQINTFASSPEYIAQAIGPDVWISPLINSDAVPLNLQIAVTTGGNVTLENLTNAQTTCTKMAGGVSAAAGQPQISTVAFGGTFEPGDKFTLIFTRNSIVQKFGADGNPFPVGIIALTFKTKMHSAIGSLVFFSAVFDATYWNRDNVDKAGAGFINAGSQEDGTQDITALGIYQGQLAIFAPKSIQLWAIDTDPANNTFLQVLQKVGTRTRRSVLSYGNNDLFFLDRTGPKSLKARDSSNAAYTADVGTAIAPLYKDFRNSVTLADIIAGCAVIEPDDGRYWLAVKGTIFVFSYFPDSKISGWSYYEPGFTITDMVETNDQIFVRGTDDMIRLYGGADGETYPGQGETPVVCKLPYLVANKPATRKKVFGIDIALTNTWKIELAFDPNDESKKLTAAYAHHITYNDQHYSVQVEASHFAPELTCDSAGKATIANMAIHYQDTVSG